MRLLRCYCEFVPLVSYETIFFMFLGYKDQTAWIQRLLNRTATDREEEGTSIASVERKTSVMAFLFHIQLQQV